eukprot:CAMPEP_0197659834 /NCGR_PEP_ID=MMETSP1338-20131121/49317_1 /TAXON_ID=43686 ORGANISM="Pelagodinium beii, Strain RCC1491" /NCGR_SAMPLE_ID=MMETSP1338 /ASSEMBLY_ACC=CAM_ASM_000754 /LENGTH=336 /DNA_ID=CAMNT_0043236959 /DNA_START=15 /DNA_END=1025 /DNA_ORIENTATION=+
MAGVTNRTPENEKGSCGSGNKAKNGYSSSPSRHTAVQAPGELLPGSSSELLALGEAAAKASEHAKAAHFFTMAIDLLAKGMTLDSKGRASRADLQKLNTSSNGELTSLLSGRSQVYLRQGDLAAAVEDAETCTRADPAFEKGHLRLAVAYEAAAAPLELQLEACQRAVDECPGSQLLVARKWKLKKALAESTSQEERPVAATEEWTIADTRSLADDSTDPRRPAAAADLGRALASGAHGLSKDLNEAARYLRLASSGGDVSAQRDLGLVLLDLGRPVEAADELSEAARAGDDEAAAVLQQLAAEAKAQEDEARAKLQEMAELGDPRAKQMLQELMA